MMGLSLCSLWKMPIIPILNKERIKRQIEKKYKKKLQQERTNNIYYKGNKTVKNSILFANLNYEKNREKRQLFRRAISVVMLLQSTHN